MNRFLTVSRSEFLYVDCLYFNIYSLSLLRKIIKWLYTSIFVLIQSGMTHHVMIGVQLLSHVVCEMNQVDNYSLPFKKSLS